MIDLSNRLEPHLGEIGSIYTKTRVNDEDRTTDDCISREMAIDAVEKKIRYTDHDEPVVDWNDFVAALCFLPSAQPQRKNGKWVEVDQHMVICPFCKHASSRKNFCAECGADMGGETHEET